MSTARSPSLKEFLDKHRADGDWNITGLVRGLDVGKYKVEDDEYDQFLKLVHTHIFGTPARASSLLEKHRDGGPLLVDLDFRYEMGGPLVRRFNIDHIHTFIAEYIAAMIYFSKVEDLTMDLCFYSLVKPSAETDKSNHKDGIHIQCPTITTEPKYQYGIRGFLLERDIIKKVFGDTGVSNPPEDCFDVSVIHRNNWFLYGACKQDKAQYRINRVWKVAIQDVKEALDGGDPVDYDEMVEIVKDLMTDTDIPPNSVETMKMLSIRCGHEVVTPLVKRDCRAKEWEDLMINWGAGKAKKEQAAKPTNEIITDDLVVTSKTPAEETLTLPENTSTDDVQLAYRIVKECLNAERRAAEYHDWINIAICLKNIANKEESFKVWVDLTRRVDPSHTKATRPEAELRTKWNLVKVGSDCRKLTIASLIRWAEEDDPKQLEAIRSETHIDWIVNYGSDTHVNVAKFVKRMFRHDFRCTPNGKRGGSCDWYHYPLEDHSWKRLKTSNELRQRLSGEVKDKYVSAVGDLGKRHNDPANANNNAERERITEKIKKLVKIQRELEMSVFKDHTMKECQEQFYDETFLDKLNTNKYLVGVANGVLDLNYYDADPSAGGRRRVNFRNGLPDDNISFQMGRDTATDAISYYPYNPEDPDQIELMNFFKKIYPDDVLRKYVLTLLASCLEGSNKEQKFYVNQGGGSNGKTMVQKLMIETFGEYQTSLNTTMLTRKRPEAGSANPDLITMKCKRFMHMSEPDNGEKLNTSCMKQVSGEDLIQARALFGDQEKFPLMGKIFLSCNDLPPVAQQDNGTWRRIRVIPHTSTFKDTGDPMIDPAKHIYEKDLYLGEKFKVWRTSFLSLLVHYYDTEYIVHGLREPSVVTAASDRYKEINDVFTVFFDDNFVKEPGAGPINVKAFTKLLRDWRRSTSRSATDLKDVDCISRMKVECGGNSTEKEFWGVRIRVDEEDISGARMP